MLKAKQNSNPLYFRVGEAIEALTRCSFLRPYDEVLADYGISTCDPYIQARIMHEFWQQTHIVHYDLASYVDDVRIPREYKLRIFLLVLRVICAQQMKVQPRYAGHPP